jgi:hypothetical protein
MASRLTGSRIASYLAVGVAGTLVGAGGLAFATSHGGVVKACASKKTGVLRVATHCNKREERAISWNTHGATGRRGPRGPRGVRGQQGIQGAQGLQGPQGIRGQVGPSNGYFNSAASSFTASLSLPAGDYMLHGVAGFTNPNTTGIDSGGCALQINNGPGTVSATHNGVTIPDSGQAQLSAEGVAHLPAASNVIYNCYATLSGTTANTAITAIHVQTASP